MRWLAPTLLLLSTAATAAELDLEALFPQQADVLVDEAGSGLVRLPLPPDVLSQCGADLANLRLFDPARRELPWLVDAGAPPDMQLVVSQSVAAEHLGERRTTIEQGQRGEIRRETLEIGAPPEAGTGGWTLVFDAAPADFVREVRVREGGGEQGRVVIESSLFRHGSRLGLERLRLALPPLDAPTLVIEIEGEDPFFLEPALRYEKTEARAEQPMLRIPLAAGSTTHEGGRTLLRVARPPGVVPELVGLETTTAFFEREVSVLDESPGRADVVLARALVRRVPGQATVETLEIPLRAASGATLRIEIDDGDSPPLDALAASGIVRQPVLVFAAAGGGPGPAATLYFGGGRAKRPRYDVSALSPFVAGAVGDPRVEARRRAFDPESARVARLAGVVPNPRFDPQPALGFLLRAGAPLDGRAFSHRRAVAVPASREGLVRVPLAAEDLAVLRPDLADLRIVDPESHQWSYLLDRDAELQEVPLGEAPCGVVDGATCHELLLPASPLPLGGLALDSAAPFFDRAFELRGKGEDGREVTIARGRLVRSADARGPVEIAVQAARVKSPRLLVSDGDDAPLAFTAIVAKVSVPHLLVAATPGSYSLLLGHPDAAAPRYDIERVRDVVLGVEAVAAAAGGLEKNAGYRATARLAQGQGPTKLLVWGAIIAAVAVLGFFTLRLARREDAG